MHLKKNGLWSKLQQVYLPLKVGQNCARCYTICSNMTAANCYLFDVVYCSFVNRHVYFNKNYLLLQEKGIIYLTEKLKIICISCVNQLSTCIGKGDNFKHSYLPCLQMEREPQHSHPYLTLQSLIPHRAQILVFLFFCSNLNEQATEFVCQFEI